MDNLEKLNVKEGNNEEKKPAVEKDLKNGVKNMIIEEPEAICIFFMQGGCRNGEDCPLSHDILPPRKLEVCRYYMTDKCEKGNTCNYMHGDFPCKFFHTDGMNCSNGNACKFSHEPLDKRAVDYLLKTLEPEILLEKEEEKVEEIAEKHEKLEIKEEETFSFYQKIN